MLDTEYKVVKLVSGENIICEVTDYGEHYEICNPLLMSVIPRLSRGAVTESLALSRWVQPFTEQKYFSIPATSVITSAEASPGLVKYYEYVLNRMEHYFDEGSLPTDEDLDEIELEEDEEFLELEGPSNKIH